METVRTKRGLPVLAVTAAVATVLLLLVVVLMQMDPGDGAAVSALPDTGAAAVQPMRLAIVPERDIFEQRQRFVALTGYLGEQLGRPVEVVTLNSYQAVLDALAADDADLACLGSLAGVLAYDRQQAHALAKPVYDSGIDVYHGLLLVREDSTIQTVDDLRGRTVAMVRTTTAGHLFPIELFVSHHMLNAQPPVRLVWVGTHDDALEAVLAGTTDAAAMKDLRFMAYEQEHGPAPLRVLAQSPPAPNNAIFARNDLDPDLAQQVLTALLTMSDTEQGRDTLRSMGLRRFVACSIEAYDGVYELIDRLGDDWSLMDIPGPPPRRDAAPAQGVN